MLCLGGGGCPHSSMCSPGRHGRDCAGLRPDDARPSPAYCLLIAALYIALAGLVAVIGRRAQRREPCRRRRRQHHRLQPGDDRCAVMLHLRPARSLLALSSGLRAPLSSPGSCSLRSQRPPGSPPAIAWTRRPSCARQTRHFLTRAAPGLIAAGIPQLKLIAAAAIVSSSPAAVSWLYYANRLYELPLGVASIAIAAVIVPRIAASLRAMQRGAIFRVQSRGFEIALGLALPAAPVLRCWRNRLPPGCFNAAPSPPTTRPRSPPRSSRFVPACPAMCWKKLFGAVSFAHGDTRTPMLTALCALATAIG